VECWSTPLSVHVAESTTRRLSPGMAVAVMSLEVKTGSWMIHSALPGLAPLPRKPPSLSQRNRGLQVERTRQKSSLPREQTNKQSCFKSRRNTVLPTEYQGAVRTPSTPQECGRSSHVQFLHRLSVGFHANIHPSSRALLLSIFACWPCTHSGQTSLCFAVDIAVECVTGALQLGDSADVQLTLLYKNLASG
jgi:hypothetical protein